MVRALLVGLFVLACAIECYAAPITFAFRGIPAGLNNIPVGSVTGTLTVDSDFLVAPPTPDNWGGGNATSRSALYTTGPYGVTAQIGDLAFAADPVNPKMSAVAIWTILTPSSTRGDIVVQFTPGAF